jgi:hypothetical protein
MLFGERVGAGRAAARAVIFAWIVKAGTTPTQPASLPGAAPYTVRGTNAGLLWRRWYLASTLWEPP